MEQNYSIFPVRASAIVTTSYVAGTVIGPGENLSQNNQLIALVSFTKGSLTTLEFKFEFSHDGTTYYQQTFGAISSGTSTDTVGEHAVSATGNYRIAIPVKDNYLKISAKGTGTVTNSLCKVDVIIGTV